MKTRTSALLYYAINYVMVINWQRQLDQQERVASQSA